MCGIVGFLYSSSVSTREKPEDLIGNMIQALVHRGPDDKGHWIATDSRIAFGHSRLSILDLSAAGHQPMASRSDRFVLIFNGEIYNHLDLREDLKSKGISNWRGHSDTETLLAGFDQWGIQATIEKTIGMFAMAIWDKESQSLSLVRDRIGEKPLYYGWQNNTFLFGSELKALKKHPSFQGEVDRNSLSLLLRHGYIPSPYSVYSGISKLQPGTILNLPLHSKTPEVQTYWSASSTACEGVQNLFSETEEVVTDELEGLLKDAVKKQMISDVPLGAFLSGGIDSSTIVALMQAQSTKPIQTFTIGFNEKEFNEAIYAKEIANHLGTDHTELYVTAQQAMDVIPNLSALYDEPFSDASQIPTFLVSQLAKKDVSVSLSGDAGDELFCGYYRYIMTAQFAEKLKSMPAALRKLIGNGIEGLSPDSWNQISNFLPKKKTGSNFGDKMHKGAKLLKGSSDDFYYSMISQWTNPNAVVLNGSEYVTAITKNSPELSKLSDIQRMMILDLLTYLPDDILVKVDRAAMGVSLETRVPFLDHRVVEFAWRIPQAMKLKKGLSKWILRQILYRYVPKELIERPKMGFSVPIGSWLRGPMKSWAEDLLSEGRLKDEGYFNPAPILHKWKDHQSGKKNWSNELWSILMFQSWLEKEDIQKT